MCPLTYFVDRQLLFISQTIYFMPSGVNTTQFIMVSLLGRELLFCVAAAAAETEIDIHPDYHYSRTSGIVALTLFFIIIII